MRSSNYISYHNSYLTVRRNTFQQSEVIVLVSFTVVLGATSKASHSGNTNSLMIYGQDLGLLISKISDTESPIMIAMSISTD